MFVYDLKVIQQSPNLPAELTAFSASGWEPVSIWPGFIQQEKQVSEGKLANGVLLAQGAQVVPVFFVVMRQPSENPPESMLTGLVKQTVEACIKCVLNTEMFDGVIEFKEDAIAAMRKLLQPAEVTIR